MAKRQRRSYSDEYKRHAVDSRLLRCARNDGIEALSAYCSGYKISRCLSAKHPNCRSTRIAKIFRFAELRKWRMCRRNPAQGRGAYRDRHERGLGGAKGFAGRATESVTPTTGAVRVRPNRVVLASSDFFAGLEWDKAPPKSKAWSVYADKEKEKGPPE
ncbi:hypothetical protein [Bradyrhizobium sp. Rc2d]|uniref:hypothetical protein n=1 Tax=Bradyrhizobium sp. Rc2d TaxID=1855321 RepID=UPI00159F71A9|nr:hypothetical protein [Bradyrhizobium sp. Rc2d]